MLNVAVAKIGLKRPRVVSLVGERIAARVPEHVRVRLESKFRLDPCSLDHACEPGGAEGCAARLEGAQGDLGSCSAEVAARRVAHPRADRGAAPPV